MQQMLLVTASLSNRKHHMQKFINQNRQKKHSQTDNTHGSEIHWHNPVDWLFIII